MGILQKSAMISLLFLYVLSALPAVAGNLDSSGAPSSGSNMPTLTDIYNQLDTGATSTPAGTFQEPLSGPAAGTGKSLSEIKAKLPAPDNTNGATANDVKSGRTFWGLRTDGTWGFKTGNNSNIADTGSGDATSSDIKNGKKAWVDGSEVTGTLYGGYICATGNLSPMGRWCDNGNGTIRDMTTGLIWLKDAGWGGGYPFWANSSSTTNAHDRAASVSNGNPATLSDGSVEGSWRLPSKIELVALTTGTEAVRSSAMYMFVNLVSGGTYWSSSTTAGSPGEAWCVNMDNGFTGFFLKAAPFYVWPVRAGQ